MSLVEIRRFADVNEAEIARGYLAANGVTAWLGGDHHARANPLIQQAIGVDAAERGRQSGRRGVDPA